MGMRNVSGGSSVGCGAFGLLSILLGVGITAFLGAKMMGDIGGTGSPPSTTVPGLALSKPGTVSDGEVIVVTSHRLPADTPVAVTTCLNLDHDPLASGLVEPRCDDTTRVVTRTDKAHHLRVLYKIRRNIRIDSRALDCSIQPGLCILHAVANGSTDAALAIDAPLTVAG